MTTGRRLDDIIAGASEGIPATPGECVGLMRLPEGSPEASRLVSAADALSRSLNGNSCSLGVQIGVVTGPCIADCGFCSFAAGTTDADDYVMPADVLRDYLKNATAHGDVGSVSLMTIHNFDFDDLADAVRVAVATVPEDVAVCVNTGDLTPAELSELRRLGVSRAYHAIRVGEGEETRLEPLDRYNTIRRISESGIEAVSCVEPIGPEHGPEDIVGRFLEAREAGCARCSASRRLDVPGTRMHGMGEISEARLAQIRAALFLMTGGDGFYGGHYGGFGMEFAEYADYSESGLGNTVEAVRRRLFKAGYGWMRVGDRRVRLDRDHLVRTGSAGP